MQLSPFVNIHCHTNENRHAVIIQNVFVQNRREIVPKGMYSLGLHPWHLNKLQADFDIHELLRYFIKRDKNLVAIGEIGIDRSIAVDVELQMRYFEIQLGIAQEYGLPVIIHCVKAYSDLIHCKKKLKITIPLIIHDYYGNEIITKELLANDFYFSFGKQCMLHNKNAFAALTIIPLHKLFLETDDEGFELIDIYRFASNELNLSIDELTFQILKNFDSVFNTLFVKK
jgi:TatD DNase family protein